MDKRRLFSSIIGLCFVALGAIVISAARAQINEFPEGPNRELVRRTCSGCHDLRMVFDTGGLSREDCDVTLTMMETYGLEIGAADRRLVLQYLATYLPSNGKRG